MIKCILFSRVSTVSQSYEEQTKELYKEAIRNGYTKDEILTIEAKESAIKYSLSERVSIQKLYDIISNTENKIECVICREISRIGRRPDVIFEVRNYLLDRKIQLICCKPYLRLLDEDGKMTQSANIMFSLFSAISESEMQIKKQRFAEGKAKKKAEGKFVGGSILYGYTVDKDNYYIVDEEKAAIVKRIFSMFLSGQYSGRQIGNIMYNEGITKRTGGSRASFVTKILKEKKYCGTNIYEPLVTKKDFDKAQELLEQHRRYTKHTYTDTLFFAHKLLFSYENNRQLMVRKMAAAYVEPVSKYIVNLNMVDSLLLHCAAYSYGLHSESDNRKLKLQYEADLKSVNKRLENYGIEEKKIQDKLDRIETRVVNGRLSSEKADMLEKDIISEQEKLLQDKRKDLELRISLEKYINATRAEKTKEIDVYGLTDQEQYDFIRQEIKKAVVKKINSSTYDIIITYNNPIHDAHIWRIYTRRRIFELFGEIQNVKFLQRYTRKE